MDRTALWNEILADTRALVTQGARGAARTLELSPDVVERLQAFVATPATIQEELFAPPPVEAPVAARDHVTEADLDALRKIVSGCEKCGLCKARTQTVFGTGNPRAEIVFVGEAPGADEDRKGEPFVGKAGMLLTDIIEKGFKIPRPEVYICNVLKCRPPENREPNPEEISQCEPYLIRQLELIKPKVIVALGGTAAKTLLKTDQGIGKLRGTWHEYHGIPLRATFHPAYLLRTPNDKGLAWLDVKEVLKFLRGEPSA